MSRSERSGCPINLALEVLGDRWSLLILRDVIFAGRRTYNELLASDEGIATNILADRLKKLVDAGLLRRAPNPEQRQRPIYSLTEPGIRLLPALVHLGDWGQSWLPASEREAEQARRLFAGGPRRWAAMMDELRRKHLDPSETAA
ncbi:winged helix-turn-helix transcriptional regulator [Labrys wisconsinensis]|uniref:DNA-binding HxlR family transcriptional regulator n=1 Tax=Labrys wisconsinensis TaxID=425677 RepID=A0ABU0JHL8_9HYPH|nr:helix-turn-helix domain-containing protein [Labrys wisconsinensis]MDQ0473783.1 DNA-binding HxlR family transcriptional regulator [Labrys wisconsinensis]